jgi:hypothetical protein
MICSEGMLDLGIDTPGYHELGNDGIQERNPLFRNFEANGTVTGYGMSRPGRIYQKFLANRNGKLSPEEREKMMTPVELGFWTTAVLEAAERSLRAAPRADAKAVHGGSIEIAKLIEESLGRSDVAL